MKLSFNKHKMFPNTKCMLTQVCQWLSYVKKQKSFQN